MAVNKCKKCGREFSTNPIVNGKKVRIFHNRSYCLKCVPYKTSASKLFSKKGTIVSCSICKKKFTYNWKGTINKCRTCYDRERRQEAKIKGIQYLGGKCMNCGWNEFVEALTFHHKDPKKKKFTISHTNVLSMSWERLRRELDKCVSLCANCHAGVHAGHIKVK